MFEKKDYIKVRGIGTIKCKPELSLRDVVMICSVAENLPFIEIGEDSDQLTYCPELAEFSFWSALILTATEYSASDRDLWKDLHETNLAQKIEDYYGEYFEEIYRGTMDRIAAKAASMQPLNEEALFNGVAKQLEGVNIGDVLNLANTISQMNGKEIVEAALTTDAP